MPQLCYGDPTIIRCTQDGTAVTCFVKTNEGFPINPLSSIVRRRDRCIVNERSLLPPLPKPAIAGAPGAARLSNGAAGVKNSNDASEDCRYFAKTHYIYRIRAACGIDRPALHAVAPGAAERGGGCPAPACTTTTTTCPNNTHIKSKNSDVHFFLNAL
jgi:hypothetical protein